MADTAVALASGNVKLVSSKVINFSSAFWTVAWCVCFYYQKVLGMVTSHFRIKLAFFVIKLFFF